MRSSRCLSRPPSGKRLYASLIEQVALAALRAAFDADNHDVADTIVLNGHVHTIDKRTGQHIHPCLVTVRATRERFERAQPRARPPNRMPQGHQRVRIESPAEMVPVRPVLDFNMVDPRFVTRERPRDPRHAARTSWSSPQGVRVPHHQSLPRAMGLETRLTQPSRDGGVDCVAYDHVQSSAERSSSRPSATKTPSG